MSSSKRTARVNTKSYIDEDEYAFERKISPGDPKLLLELEEREANMHLEDER